ncbi:MAG: glycosyltransferase family 4 protein [Anaerolineae bacterium]|nr:glycosyltransferase family 4 protein [Anaerolineae bacterium]
MKILVVADGRSPITRGWVRDLLETGHKVILVSSFPYQAIPGVTESHVIPIAFSQFAGSQAGQGQFSQRASVMRRLLKRFRSTFQSMRYFLGPLTLVWYRPRFRRLVSQVKPDLIHALRIPFEGMLAVSTAHQVPLVISIWGNDLTLHAPKNILMRILTRHVLKRCAGLITDVERDLTLAERWGFQRTVKPAMVALTSGGIDVDAVQAAGTGQSPLDLPDGTALVINPRGIRPGYVRNDTWFEAIPLVLAQWNQPILFACPSMAGQPEALEGVTRYGVEQYVHLLPFLSQQELWQWFNRCQVMVSVTEHDGTPNSLLESMAAGAFPIAGDIASLREWITPGVNGTLIDPSSAPALAEAIVEVLRNPVMQLKAAEINRTLVRERADRRKIRLMREDFYSQIRNQSEAEPSA